MNLYDRIALYLWRDRGGYEVGTGGMSEDYNRSLLTRFRHWRYVNRGFVVRAVPWLLPALIGAGAAVGAVVLTKYLDRPISNKQVEPHAGELLLRCLQESNGVLRCVPAGGREDQVVARPNGDRLNNQIPAKK